MSTKSVNPFPLCKQGYLLGQTSICLGNIYCHLSLFTYTFPLVYHRFATTQKNGLLFYNGRYNEMHDFIALEVVDGQVQFSFSLGSKTTTVRAHVEGGVDDGKWQEVRVEYLNRVSMIDFYHKN